jgi:hypothetical protein
MLSLCKLQGVSIARVFVVITMMIHVRNPLTTVAASASNTNNSYFSLENVDIDIPSAACKPFDVCVHLLKLNIGKKIAFEALKQLQSCLQQAVVECYLHAPSWFGLADVIGAMGNSNTFQQLCKTGDRLSMDQSRVDHRNGRRRPFLSIVVAGRADTYRGDPMKRACLGLRSIAINANLVRIHTEVIFVDYNPPTGSSTADALRECIENISRVHLFFTLRVVVVPLWMLQVSAAISTDGPLLPFNEYVAKNVGIRRAAGNYILVSNPEIILPSALWSQFAKNPQSFFRSDLLVSSDRRDSFANIEEPLFVSVNELEKKLAAGVRFVWSHLQENGSTLPRASDHALSPAVYFHALQNALVQCPWQDPEIRWQGNGTNLAATFSGMPSVNSIHHTAAGDFIMVHRAVWMRTRGYFDVWSFDRPPIDSITVTKMLLGLKLRQMVLRGQYAVLHYSDEPFKYTNPDELIGKGRNRVSDMPADLKLFYFYRWISLRSGSTLASVNSCTWGLCSPFSALQLPFTTERLFRCGSGDPSATCSIEPKEFFRMCTKQFPFQNLDYFLMPALQQLDDDPSVAIAIVNTGCLMMQRNQCAAVKRARNESETALSSTSCCANLAAAKAAMFRDEQSHPFEHLPVICG